MSISKKYQEGGYIDGKSHEEGGEMIEVEGGEIVVNDTVNGAASIHGDKLLALNKNPQNYDIIQKGGMAKGGGIVEKDAQNRSLMDILEYVNEHGDVPSFDARNRSKK